MDPDLAQNEKWDPHKKNQENEEQLPERREGLNTSTASAGAAAVGVSISMGSGVRLVFSPPRPAGRLQGCAAAAGLDKMKSGVGRLTVVPFILFADPSGSGLSFRLGTVDGTAEDVGAATPVAAALAVVAAVGRVAAAVDDELADEAVVAPF